MGSVTSFFLRAKHWQIFLLIFGTYAIGQILALNSIVAAQPAEKVGGFGTAFWILMAIFGFCYLAWFWSMGSFLTSILRPELKLKLGFFRFALIYSVVYAFFFFTFVLRPGPAALSLVIPAHSFAMFCLLYLWYFDSKSFALAEKDKPVSFRDYAGPFFLLWFFLIGVWVIQPKINRLYSEKHAPTS